MRKDPITKLSLIGIVTKDKIYLSDDVNGTNSFYNSSLLSYKFDGETPTLSYKKNWIVVPKFPFKITKQLPEEKINQRWELDEQLTPTSFMPKILPYEYDEESAECEEWNSCFPYQYGKYFSLYTLVFDVLPAKEEEIEFSIDIIAKYDEFEFPDVKYRVKYNLVDEVTTHPTLLPTKPCKLSSEDSYKIIREHVKRNIDRNVATITSDYDFCFTVQKRITIEGKWEEFYYPFAKKAKDKTEKRFVTDRKMVIFETAPDRGGREGVYKGYTRTKEFEGKDYNDMVDKMTKYLDNLMEEINSKLKDCPHCKGFGVVPIEKENTK